MTPEKRNRIWQGIRRRMALLHAMRKEEARHRAAGREIRWIVK